ncbi:MAG: glycosyltransferase [Clostridiales bacterium]|nr:glycosyltransferase [Clostridiales bacterium]
MKNVNKAYLCYEQALYLCKEEENKQEIRYSISNLIENNNITVNKISFIILTYNELEYTKVCIDSIRKYNNPDTYEIIIVDNNSTDGTVEWIKNQKDIKAVFNDDNKGFPKGCNQGISIANKNNDIMLLNNDTVLMTNSMFNMRMGLYSNDNIGATGAVSNNVSNCQMISETFEDFDGYLKFANKNNIPNEMLHEERVKLVGFAMLIKREVLEKTGYLDERFTPGNFEDDDISLRIIMEGYKLLLCKDSYIHHFGSVSFRNVKGGYNELLEKNNKKFIDKWNFSAYESQRFYKTIYKYIADKDNNILEINAGGGSNLVSMRNEFNNRNYYAYEKNPNLIEMNRKLGINLIEDLNEDKYLGFFDLIILTEYEIIQNRELMYSIKKLLNDENGTVIIVLDAYKEDKNAFLNCEVEKFIKDFSKNNYKMVDYEALGSEDEIAICTILFQNITANNIKKEVFQLLSQGRITKALNYLVILENTNIFDNVEAIREELEDEFELINKIKFSIRRIDVDKLQGYEINENSEVIQELFNAISDNKISDECIIGIINEDIINKNYVLNYMAIEYFAREEFDRVLPYLQQALIIDNEDLDTIYNIAYVLNCFGEKEKALEYLESVKEKNEEINNLVMEINRR